jgi:hypothetical protein
MWVRIWVHNFEDKSYFRTCNDSEKKIAKLISLIVYTVVQCMFFIIKYN